MVNNIMNKTKYLKTIKKENEDILNKYKKIVADIDNIEILLEKKIKYNNFQLEKTKNSYLESMNFYHSICKNLIN